MLIIKVGNESTVVNKLQQLIQVINFVTRFVASMFTSTIQ